jgi:hypothetical protein
MGTGHPRLTGNVNSEHSELATTQRARPKNPGSARKGSKPSQGLDHRPTEAPDLGRKRGHHRLVIDPAAGRLDLLQGKVRVRDAQLVLDPAEGARFG